mgnify:FL=1
MIQQSKKQKLNKKIYDLTIEWLDSILPDGEVTEALMQKMIPKERYFCSQGQIRLNAYTYKWFRKRVKKASRLKSIEEVTLQDIENA